MKLVLNGKTDELIKVDNFSRNLNIPSEEVLFDINFFTSDLTNALSMNYITQYATNPITSYTLMDDEGNIVLNVEETEAKLISFNENFFNNSYNASAIIQELEK